VNTYFQLVSIGYHPTCNHGGIDWIGPWAELEKLRMQQIMYKGAVATDAVKKAIKILESATGQ